MPPEPSSVSPQVTAAMLRVGDAVTITALDAHRVYRVLGNTLVDGLRELRLRDERERVVRMRGGDVVVRHDHLFDAADAAVEPAEAHPLAVASASTPLDEVVLGPPPVPQRMEHPYAGTIHYQGLLIYVENPIGSTRSGVDADGKPWSVVMTAHYGEIAHTVAADGDPLDVFVGPDPNADTVYVIQTKVPGTQEFDEVKAMLGYGSRSAAVAAFRAHYTRPGFMSGITVWPIDDFKRALCRPMDVRGKLDQNTQASRK